jgi:transcriptional regulator with XRE-family HTH domain
MPAFRELLRELVTQFGGTKQDLAKAIGITASTLSHFLRDHSTHVPSTEVCLRLAAVTGASASKVLRAAGKGDVADLIEDLFGVPATRRQTFLGIRLTPHEQKHVETLRTLTPKVQRAYFVIVEAAADEQLGKRLQFPLERKG